jgi:hypothetical protein
MRYENDLYDFDDEFREHFNDDTIKEHLKTRYSDKIPEIKFIFLGNFENKYVHNFILTVAYTDDKFEKINVIFDLNDHTSEKARNFKETMITAFHEYYANANEKESEFELCFEGVPLDKFLEISHGKIYIMYK